MSLNITGYGDVWTLQITNSTDSKTVELFFDEYSNIMDKYSEDVAQELGISKRVALDIIYLRSRSRWTQELEQKLIDAYKEGKPIQTKDVISGDWPY